MNNGHLKRQNGGNPNRGNQNHNQNQGGFKPLCANCGTNNMGECLKGSRVYFLCNEPGHLKRNCPKLRANGGVQPGNANPGRNENVGRNYNNQRQTGKAAQGLVQGRAYALVPENALVRERGGRYDTLS